MAGMLKKILRAAVAQPWDYMGGGAPTEWEFRVSPDEETVAVWNPHAGTWSLLTSRGLRLVAEAELEDGQQGMRDWSRYVEETDDE